MNNKNNALLQIHFFLPFIIAVFMYTSCSVDSKTTNRERRTHRNATLTYQALVAQQEQEQQAVEQFLDTLSPQEQVAQLFLVNLEGDRTFVPVEKVGDLYNRRMDSAGKNDCTPLIPGGYLFFSYNIASDPVTIMQFTDAIRKFCTDKQLVPPYLAVDQEGGMVNRLRGVTSVLPSNARVAECLSPQEARLLYELQAVQLSSLGFNMNLAPVVEVETDANSAFLSDRSYGAWNRVRSYGAVAVDAYEKNGIGTVLKHFPGNTNVDPHTGLPEITLSAGELDRMVITPFTQLSYFHPSAILMSHARTQAYDAKTPACLSPYWVTERLRTGMGYTGLVISDDIFMAALEKNGYPPEQAAVQAIVAGVDVIMLSEKRCAPVARILLERAAKDESFAKKLRAAQLKVLTYKVRAHLLSFDGAAVTATTATESVAIRMQQFSSARRRGEQLYKQRFTGETK